MAEPERIKRIYDRNARRYERWGGWFQRRFVDPLRERVLPRASGRVLELGFGNGESLRFYEPERIDELIVLDVSEGMLEIGREKLEGFGAPWEVVAQAVERAEFPEASFDTVVSGLMFCGVEDQSAQFDRVSRWLRPGGEFLLVEHVLGNNWLSALACRLFSPLNRSVFGCALDRRTFEVLREQGFKVDELGSTLGGIFRCAVARREGRSGK